MREGYSETTLSGDGATDRVLSNLSKRVGSGLKKFKLQNSSTVTDLGLHALVHNSKHLLHIHLEELAKVSSGGRARDSFAPSHAHAHRCARAGDFLVDMFEKCTKLQSVMLSGMPTLSWAPCKGAAQRWPALKITKLHVRGVNLDSEFGIVLAKMPHLVELEIDGHARNITAAALTW